MRVFSLVLIILSLLLSSCSDETNPIEQSNINNHGDLKKMINKISVELVDYDSILISDNSNFFIHSKDIKNILIGTKENDIFKTQDSVLANYIEEEDGYKVEFNIGQKVDKSLRIYNLFVRFILTDLYFLDFDTVLTMYKYPYKSAEIFLTFEEIFYEANGPERVQDFKFSIDNMCICPTGANFLWQYDFSSEHIHQLVEEQCDYLAYDSTYLFATTGSAYYYTRYDIENDTTEWFSFGNKDTEYNCIGGIDIYNGSLYTILYSNDLNSGLLNNYDLNGNLIESIPYGRITHHMTIYNQIVYSIFTSGYRNPPVITRFDLNTKEFLEDRYYPASDWYGIDIMEENFYYVDLSKEFIGYIPLSELE